jgi:hypothetical protein
MKFTDKHFAVARSFILKNEFPDWVLGFKTILMGAPGSGKTSSIASLLQMGFKCYGLFTEQGIGNLLKACRTAGCTDEDMGRLFYTYVPPGSTSFDTLSKGAKAIQDASEFGKMDNKPMDRKKYGQLINCMKACEDFIDQNGVSHGSIEAFGCNSVFFVDGMSNLARMAMQIVVGTKPVKTLQDWGVAIDNLENFENQITTIKAPFVLLTHIERETDEVTQKVFVTIATLGNKYPLRLGRNYHDVILTEQKEGKFTWSTTSRDCQLKGTFLPIAASMEPDFKPLVCQWLLDNGLVKYI